ncbi:MAG: c-type cytochrome [Chitinophagaceae bacterium]|nr:MAG: c-type cytochrome [Chitinophagaceae bacterium]
MNDHRIGVKTLLQLFLIFIFSVGKLQAQDGAAIFQQNCASCHALNKDLTGPKLAGVEGRGPWSDRKKLYAWIHNPAKFMQTDAYTAGLKQQYGGVMMTAFPQLSEKEIDAIITYISKAPAAPAGGGTAAQGQTVVDESDSNILYGILTLILAVVALIMLQVNSNLRKLADDKDGVPAREPIPFYRNKSYITLITLVLFIIGGYFVVRGAINLGRNKGYEPEQPIYYSHKVHAGQNQISCLYCHGSAYEGKQANIPSLNTCMNCHMTINEYTGADIFKHDGSKVDGTAEIQKIYEHVGWDPASRSYTGEGKPVEWVRIHNLPDHVYFNHSQHTVAGQVQCQTCHGEIQKMDEVKQFTDLSMGWCVNCHRETKVNFVDSSGTKGNQFYSIYEKYHDEIKRGIRDSITVNDIGGTECQKCHY